jgi:serine/threonine-protein kinase
VQQQLTRWRNEPNLAGLRDRAELARLPADERQECLSLWNEADGLLEPSRRAAGVP